MASGNVILATFYLDLESAQCGYPICCPGNQPHFKPMPFFPENLQPLGVENDLKEVMSEIDVAFHETGMPMFPCICHHFCLPFSPICAAFYCQGQRKSRIDEALAKWNNEKGVPKGLFVQMNNDYQMMYQNTGRGYAMLMLKPGMEIQMNVNQHQEYCAKQGIQFNPSVIPAQQAPNPFNPMNSGMMPPPGSYGSGMQAPPGAYPGMQAPPGAYPGMQAPPGSYPGMQAPYPPQAGAQYPPHAPPPSHAPAPYPDASAPASYGDPITQQPPPTYNQVYDDKKF